MLILTRRKDENIRIGDEIKVYVLEIRSGQVKLGIDAPQNIRVYREEIYQRIQDEIPKEMSSSGLQTVARIFRNRSPVVRAVLIAGGLSALVSSAAADACHEEINQAYIDAYAQSECMPYVARVSPDVYL